MNAIKKQAIRDTMARIKDFLDNNVWAFGNADTCPLCIVARKESAYNIFKCDHCPLVTLFKERANKKEERALSECYKYVAPGKRKAFADIQCEYLTIAVNFNGKKVGAAEETKKSIKAWMTAAMEDFEAFLTAKKKDTA